MKETIHRVIFPDGDFQDIAHSLRINQLVDVNGYPISLPLQTAKTIAYEVFKVQHKSTRNEEITEYYLELCNKYELEQYVMAKGSRK